MSSNKSTFQSPVNIIRASTNQIHCGEEVLQFNYHPTNNATLTNTGRTWQVDFHKQDNLHITGGPLSDNAFILDHIECRWGCSNNRGSEHRIESLPYSGELHFVHWNAMKYKSMGEACQQIDGLVIIALFLRVSRQQHDELNKITKLLRLVEHKNDQLTLPFRFDPKQLFPDQLLFYCYNGSLTLCPFTESVLWLVMKKSIEISDRQLEEMRRLRRRQMNEKDPGIIGSFIVSNFRKPKSMNDRTVFEYLNY